MPLTYNKVIKLSREFQQAHYALNHFANGSDYDTVLENTEGGVHYPIMYMEDLAMPLQEGVEVMSFRVGFLGLVEQLENRDDSLISANRNEVISDMMQCAKDFVAYWVQDHTYSDFRIQKGAQRNTVEDVTPDKLWGCYVDITFEQAFKYDKCAIPMGGVTPPDSNEVTITVNSTAFTVVGCGSTFNVPVKDTDGNLVGSKIGGEWIVNVGGDPVANSMNGAALTDAASGTTKTFVITYADLSAVTVTGTSDSATAFVGTVPTPKTVTFNRPEIAQSTVYATYDAAWRFDNGYIPVRTSSQFQQELDANDFTKIKHDDSVITGITEHLFRFVGVNGGYVTVDTDDSTKLWFLKDGTASTENVTMATPSGDNMVIDRLTGLAWAYDNQRVSGGGYVAADFYSQMWLTDNYCGYTGGWFAMSTEEMFMSFIFGVYRESLSSIWRDASWWLIGGTNLSSSAYITSPTTNIMALTMSTYGVGAWSRTQSTASGRYYLPVRTFEDWPLY